MAAPTLERIFASIFCGLGDISGQEDIAVDIMVEESGIANHIYCNTVELAASDSTSVNLSTIFEGVRFVLVHDVTANGAGGLQVGGNTDKFTLTAGGFVLMDIQMSGTPPTLYITAPAGESKYVEIVAIGKRA